MHHLTTLIITFLLLFTACTPVESPRETQSGAGQALDMWSFTRSYPTGEIPARAYRTAYRQLQNAAAPRSEDADWQALGPKNIGGRTLCLAFHPNEPETIYAGSASGGLWKTQTAGAGYVGWEKVAIDFPVLGVPAVVINPDNPDEMYIGTGEVYNNQESRPGTVNRYTRGSYGIGILKTTDGGETWEQSWTRDFSDLTGVSDLAIVSDNPSTVFAATSEGLYRTQNAGTDWELVLDLDMTYHIAIDPQDSQNIFVTVGALINTDTGIYRSTDGGDTFTLVGNGAPAGYTGKARIKFSAADSEVVYCSAADYNGSNDYGLYRSNDAGVSWQLVNNENVPTYQGWFAHDVLPDPTDTETLLWVGVDAYKSVNGGSSIERKSYWYNWDFGQTPVGGPEGPGDYVHADIHAVYAHPTQPQTYYAATDGGIFVSFDQGENWEGRNGSYQTQQFYADFSSNDLFPDLAIGGMQDNATAIYRGEDSWQRVIGGDGGSAEAHPADPAIFYGTSQNLGLRRSTDGGDNFNFIAPEDADFQNVCFIAPIEIYKPNPDIIYCAAQQVFRSEDGGDSWTATSPNFLDPDLPIMTIGTAESDPQVLYAATVPNPFNPALGPGKVFRSTDGGATWDWMSQLPDRICTDIAVDPTNADRVFVTFSGFGGGHVFKTENGGAEWTEIAQGLPDVPTNTVAIDPLEPRFVYIGNDVGVWLWNESGETSVLTPFQTGLPGATLVMHLDIQDSERVLRAATHGSGVWESPLAENPLSVNVSREEVRFTAFPNPTTDVLTVVMSENMVATGPVQLYDLTGKLLLTQQVADNAAQIQISLGHLSAGLYILKIGEESVRLRKV